MPNLTLDTTGTDQVLKQAENKLVLENLKKPEPSKNEEVHLHIDLGSVKEKTTEKKKVEAKIGLMDLYNKLNNAVVNSSPIKMKEKVVFFRLLATMINAGLPLVKSLKILGEQVDNIRFQRVILELSDSVQQGKALAISMEGYPDIFEESTLGIIKAGEISGKLNAVLTQLADQMEKTESIRSKTKGAMIYPMVILSILALVMIAVMTLIVPKITVIFENANVELPLSTQILMGISHFLINSWYILVGGIILFIIAFKYWKKTDDGRYAWDKFVLNMPVFGSLNRKACISRFTRGFAMMTSSGIAVVKGLQINADAIGNEVYRERILLSAEDVKQGIQVAQTLSGQEKYFPSMVVHMIAVGEQTAQIEQVSNKIADFYDSEIDETVKNISAIMEPFIIVVIGITVGGLVAAIMQPIMKMSEVASGG